jgi:hypothetical protein
MRLATDDGRIPLGSAGPFHGLGLLLLVMAVLAGFVALVAVLVRRWRRQRAQIRLLTASNGQTRSGL